MSIKVAKDALGIPTTVEIKSGGRFYKVEYDRDQWKFNREPTKQVLDMLSLVYPVFEKSQPEKTELGEMVSEVNTINNAYSTAYYVPRGKKLHLVSVCLSTSRHAAGAAPTGQFQIVFGSLTAAHTLIVHHWTYVGTDVQTTWCSIDVPLRFGLGVRAYANADADVAFSYLGYLTDV